MKPLNTILTVLALTLLLSHNAQAQLEEAVFVNGGEIFLHKDTSLQLKSILTSCVDGKTYLTWVADDLKNNGTFIVSRSMDGENFEIIGVKQSIMVSDRRDVGYFFIDNDPISSTSSYYKITHLDTDNGFFISKSVASKSPAVNFSGSFE